MYEDNFINLFSEIFNNNFYFLKNIKINKIKNYKNIIK